MRATHRAALGAAFRSLSPHVPRTTAPLYNSAHPHGPHAAAAPPTPLPAKKTKQNDTPPLQPLLDVVLFTRSLSRVMGYKWVAAAAAALQGALCVAVVVGGGAQPGLLGWAGGLGALRHACGWWGGGWLYYSNSPFLDVYVCIRGQGRKGARVDNAGACLRVCGERLVGAATARHHHTRPPAPVHHRTSSPLCRHHPPYRLLYYRRGQFALYGYYLAVAHLLRAISPPMASMVAQEASLSGAFRRVISRQHTDCMCH